MNTTNKITLKDFGEGTILWGKIIFWISAAIGASYMLSQIDFRLGILFIFYLFLFAAPSFMTDNNIIGILLAVLPFLVYTFLLVNIAYIYFKEKKLSSLLTTLFIVATVLYLLSIVVGWFIILVWHP